MSRVQAPRLARSVLLLGFCVLILKLLATGQMRYYMSPSFDGLTALTGIVLGAIGGLELRKGVRGASGPAPAHGDLDIALTLGLVAVPLVLALTFTPRALGASGLGGRSVSGFVVAFDAGPPPAVTAPAPRQPIADVADLLSYLRQAGESGVGQPVHARGLVARSDDLPTNQFVLLRYAIVHCVADAQPLGFLIVAPGATSFANDQWVEVEGRLASEPRGSDRVVAIQVERIVPAQEPTDPYVPAF